MVNASNRIGPPKHTSSPGFQPDLAWETREGASVEISGGPLLLAVSPPHQSPPGAEAVASASIFFFPLLGLIRNSNILLLQVVAD